MEIKIGQELHLDVDVHLICEQLLVNFRLCDCLINKYTFKPVIAFAFDE